MSIANSAHIDTTAIKIIIAEDHHIVRNGLLALMEKQEGISVVGEAANGNEVLKLLEGGLVADIILTDINMPGMDGLKLIEELKLLHPRVKVAVLSMLDNEKFIINAFKAGACAYLLKNTANDEMVFALKQAYAGNQYVSTEIAAGMLKRLMRLPESPNKDHVDTDLSERDIEVLNLIGDGFTNDEIADKLFTSKRTVEGYRQSLITRTGSRNTAALIKYACMNGLLD